MIFKLFCIALNWKIIWSKLTGYRTGYVKAENDAWKYICGRYEFLSIILRVASISSLMTERKIMKFVNNIVRDCASQENRISMKRNFYF